MPKYHQMQLPDGRFVRMRELTSALQAIAFEAASERLPNGTIANTNPVRVEAECLKLSLVAITEKKSLWKLDTEGKPLPVLDPKTKKPAKRPDGKPILQRFDPADLDEKDWKSLTYSQLETDYDDLFGPKDRLLLAKLYNLAHVPGEEEADFFGTIHSVSVSD